MCWSGIIIIIMYVNVSCSGPAVLEMERKDGVHEQMQSSQFQLPHTPQGIAIHCRSWPGAWGCSPVPPAPRAEQTAGCVWTRSECSASASYSNELESYITYISLYNNKGWGWRSHPGSHIHILYRVYTELRGCNDLCWEEDEQSELTINGALLSSVSCWCWRLALSLCQLLCSPKHIKYSLRDLSPS